MKSAFLTSLCAVLLTLGLTSCPETKVSKDFGGNILQFNREDWEGDWKSADSSDNVKFFVKDTAAGQLTLFITKKEKNTESKIDVLLHETENVDGKLAFLTTLDEADNSRGSLLLVTLPDKGVFHFWGLRHDAVEAAVKSGELSGKLIPVKEQGDEEAHNHSELNSDKANYKKLMDAKFWEWAKPTTMIRAPKK